MVQSGYRYTDDGDRPKHGPCGCGLSRGEPTTWLVAARRSTPGNQGSSSASLAPVSLEPQMVAPSSRLLAGRVGWEVGAGCERRQEAVARPKHRS